MDPRSRGLYEQIFYDISTFVDIIKCGGWHIIAAISMDFDLKHEYVLKTSGVQKDNNGALFI